MKKVGLRHQTFILSTLATIWFLSLSGISAQVIDNSAGTVNSETSSEDYDLTDTERYESQTFVHTGLNNRQIEEECAKLKDSSACQGNGSTKFLGIDSGMVQAVSKVYSMFGAVMGASGGGGFSAPKARPATPPADAAGNPATGEAPTTAEQAPTGEGESKQDYCAYIPAVGETLATFTQQLGQQTIATESQGQETQQKAQLYQASRSHGTRAKTAKMQGTVWGSTAACYGAYMASGKIAIDWKVIAKAAGAGFLTIFWFNEAKQQEYYASEVKRIADELPGTGVCNPHTEKDCYCAQPETQYDPVHCVPELHKNAVATTSFRVPCADKDMQPDASCDCIGTNACFDTEYFSNITAPGFVQFANSSAGQDFKDLTRGSLNNGTLSAGTNSSSAKARKLLGDLAPKVTANPSLNKSGISANDAFKSLGVPGSISRLLASQKISPQAKSKVSSLTSGFGKATGNFAASKKGASRKSRVLRFNKAKSSIRSKKKSSSSSAFNFKRKKSKTRASSKILKFAQRAQKKAQITKNKDRPIFEIISRRYQVSGWKRLEIQ